MEIWYIAYNLELTKKCYLLNICEGTHDEGAMKSGSSTIFNSTVIQQCAKSEKLYGHFRYTLRLPFCIKVQRWTESNLQAFDNKV